MLQVTTSHVVNLLTMMNLRYDTRREDSLTCAQKPTQVSLIYRMEPTTKKWKREKLESKKTDMLRSIGKQSGESVESVLRHTAKYSRDSAA